MFARFCRLFDTNMNRDFGSNLLVLLLICFVIVFAAGAVCHPTLGWSSPHGSLF